MCCWKATKMPLEKKWKFYWFHKYLACKINDLNNSAHLNSLLAGSGMWILLIRDDGLLFDCIPSLSTSHTVCCWPWNGRCHITTCLAYLEWQFANWRLSHLPSLPDRIGCHLHGLCHSTERFQAVVCRSVCWYGQSAGDHSRDSAAVWTLEELWRKNWNIIYSE